MVQPLHDSLNPGIRPNPAVTLNTQNSWGRTTTINGAKAEQIVRVQLPEIMSYVTVVVRAINVSQGDGSSPVYPMARIQYGNGNVLSSNIIDATGGAEVVVIGSTIQVEVFLATKDGTVVDHTASADFSAWACIGFTPYIQRNTSFTTKQGAATGVLIEATPPGPMQGKVTRFFGVADLSAAVFIQFFDKDTAPAAGDIPIAAGAIGTGVLNWEVPFPNDLRFLEGISWGLSSTPLVYTAAAGTNFSVNAEVVNSG